MEEAAKLVEQMKLAEQAERYKQMSEFGKSLVMKAESLSEEQRNLVSVAYKNVVGKLRSAWRVISSIEQNEKDKGETAALAVELREEIEKEMKDVIGDVLVSNDIFK